MIWINIFFIHLFRFLLQNQQVDSDSNKNYNLNKQIIKIQKQMIQNRALKGLLCMIGSFMISLAVGLMYLWGIITIYATSYFRIVSKNPNLTEQTTDIVFPLTLLGQAITIPFAARFVRKTSSRTNCLVAGFAMAFCLYMSSYCQSFKAFAIIYGFFTGLIIGVIYIIPIAHCYQFFPNKRSSVSIILVSASGIGTLIFAFIGFNMMNFDNVSVTSTVDGFYGSEIAMKFPDYLRVLSSMMLFLISGGSLLLFEFPNNVQIKQEPRKKKGQNNLAELMDLQFTLEKQQSDQAPKNPFGNMNYEMAFISKGFQNGKMYGQKQDRQFWPSINSRQSSKYVAPDLYDNTNDHSQLQAQQNQVITNECPRTRDGPKEPIFWKIFIVIVLGTNFGLMMANNYKTYVKNVIPDERFLVTVGALGAVVCGFSRFIWGLLLERMSFKVVYSFLCIINAFIAFTVFYIKSVQVFYIVYVMGAYLCYGGHQGIFPALSSQVFGLRYGPQIYGILFLAFPVSNFLQCIIINWIPFSFGYWFVFMISGGMSCLAFVISNKVQYKYDWSDRIRENNQRKRLMAR